MKYSYFLRISTPSHDVTMPISTSQITLTTSLLHPPLPNPVIAGQTQTSNIYMLSIQFAPHEKQYFLYGYCHKITISISNEWKNPDTNPNLWRNEETERQKGYRNPNRNRYSVFETLLIRNSKPYLTNKCRFRIYIHFHLKGLKTKPTNRGECFCWGQQGIKS